MSININETDYLSESTSTKVDVTHKEVLDVIIVGSGPAGYSSAIYAGRSGLKTLVLAGVLEAGGALMTTTDVENFPGFPDGVLGPVLMESLEAQAGKFGAEIKYEDAVEFDLIGDVKTVTTLDGVYKTRAVVLAMGSAHRKLGLQNESELTGRGVSYCATCDGFFFKGKSIVVVGGGDSAVEEALFFGELRGECDSYS